MDVKMDTKTDMGTDTGMNIGTDLKHPRLNHYLLGRELGRGFSAIVYEAADERQQRTVALKVLTFLQTLSEDRRADLAARFRREAQAISALSHPNIVAIYEVGQADDGRQYIAMECLPGETLRRRLQRSSPLSTPEAVAVAVRIADALHYAHSRGIVHRDIKPDNIFLAQSAGSEETPKLMDFGIAHLLSDQGLTQDGTIVGSPAYMSPEQINGQMLDARTDIFSLAVMLTEMVTGAKPFEGETIPAVMQKILRHAPDLRAVADHRLSRVLAKALSKNPNARYPDAAAFGEALRRAVPMALAAPSVATQIITGVPPRPAVFQTPRRARWAAVGLSGLALTALAALPLVAKKQSTPAYAAMPTSPSSQAPVTPAPPALSPGAHRHRIAAAWHPAARRPADMTQNMPQNMPQNIAQDVSRRTPHSVPRNVPRNIPRDTGMVRIAEVTPVRPHSYYPHSAQISSVTQPPKTPPALKPLVPAVPARPVVRVAGMHQEMNPAGEAAAEAATDSGPTAETKPLPTSLPTPPREPRPADAPPRPLHCPLPSALAEVDSPSAAVRLRLSVDEDGDVTEATILASSGSRELDDAALDAVGHWEYTSALKNGRSVPGEVIETVKFSRR